MAVNKRRYMYYNGTGYDEEHFVTDANITYMNDGTTVEDKLKMYTTTNSSNAYSVTIPNLASLTDGLNIRVKFNVASTGAITLNINSLGAKSVKDFFGNSVTNVRANLPANLTYESISDSFILLGKGGGGNAVATDLLSGKTATTDNGQITGNMPNNPAQVNAVSVDSSGTNKYFRIPTGAYLTKASQGYPEIIASATQIDSNIVSANIKKNVSICGVAGGIDLSNLKPENVKKDVNINGTIGTLEEKFSSFECMKNLSTDYLLLAVINNQYYCYKPSSQRTCHILNTDGTVLKTITNSDADYYPFLVTKDYIFWSDAGAFIISDLNGVTLKRITSSYTAITGIKINNQYLVFDNSMFISLFDSNFNLIRQYYGSNSSVIGVFNKDDICIYLKGSSNEIYVYYLDINSTNDPKQIGRSGLTNTLQFLNN